MKVKTQGFWIKRIHTIEITDKNGNTKTQKEPHWFTCRANAAIPPNHNLLKYA